jgi:hypothetical protein
MSWVNDIHVGYVRMWRADSLFASTPQILSGKPEECNEISG